ncbi:sensor domain-containing diguanylate cyclase [Cellulomonas sp. DKR-3]|uniref:Sensor domain-containing diguanylate cyclase n=1 Tax=Cellulomonas fulva TaxID=2835530 RepID=A0ABS5TWY6_9CELL|nr:sensor domain-containing diguanylate cyclase [Cellulomonas fulva]MBT0993635.1 sensor domain-containing diguanylate cyclase [Cellulomonas fulva]
MTRRATAGARGGRRAAAAIGGARGFAAAAHRLDRCRTLEEVVQTAAELGLELLGARRACMCRIEQDTCHVLVVEPPSTDQRHAWRLRTSYRADERPALRRLIRDRESWVAHAQDITGQPIEPGDEGAGDPIEVATLKDVGGSSSLGVPVVVNGTVWGQLFAMREPGDGLFTVDDVARAEVIGALAAGAIARVDLEAQIRHLVADDPLTGLVNRRVADAAAEAALESGEEVCIVMCDVDGLKRVNDRLGHESGDDLLRTVADVLRRAADRLPGSTAARLGGDEFCLVVVGHHRSEVSEVMASTTADFPLPHGAAISYGLASTAVSGEVSARHLFRRADIAQYRVKRARARARKSAVPIADPAVTAERVVVAGAASITAAQSGIVPRLCAMAAATTETLGGSDWAVLMQRDGDEAAVARGGSPADTEREQTVTRVAHGTWVVEVGASASAATGQAVSTALHALVAVAVEGAS